MRCLHCVLHLCGTHVSLWTGSQLCLKVRLLPWVPQSLSLLSVIQMLVRSAAAYIDAQCTTSVNGWSSQRGSFLVTIEIWYLIVHVHFPYLYIYITVHLQSPNTHLNESLKTLVLNAIFNNNYCQNEYSFFKLYVVTMPKSAHRNWF